MHIFLFLPLLLRIIWFSNGICSKKKKFQINVQLWHQKCTDFRYKTSCRLKQNKWLLGDIECICKMATDGPIQFSTHLSVSSTPAMCMCVEYIVMPYLSYGFCFAAQNDVGNCNFPKELICCVFIFMHGVYQMRDGMSSMLIPFCVILRFICILLFFLLLVVSLDLDLVSIATIPSEI